MKYVKNLMEQIYDSLAFLPYEIVNEPILDSENPYILIEDPASAEIPDVKQHYHERIIITISAISFYNGSLEVIEMLEDIQSALESLGGIVKNESIINNGNLRVGSIQIEFRIL
jgi:hypothetical protein